MISTSGSTGCNIDMLCGSNLDTCGQAFEIQGPTKYDFKEKNGNIGSKMVETHEQPRSSGLEKLESTKEADDHIEYPRNL